MNKTLLVLMLFSHSIFADNISPFTIGQSLDSGQASAFQQRYQKRTEQAWKVPPPADRLKQHKNEVLIRYGIRLLDKTAAAIGPQVKDSSLRYSGNNLNCSNCHLKGDTGLPGTRYFGLPFTNLRNDYPKLSVRNMRIIDAADRVNGCMTRSMGNGRPLPKDSKEMQAILAYFDWLAEGTEPYQAMAGTGIPVLKLPSRAADPVQGKKVYDSKCVACHDQQGIGKKAPDYASGGGYLFPPLAGNDSYNDGAGMSRLIKASRFVRANMPLGTTWKSPQLSVDEAYDVAAYIDSLPRPQHPQRENDFPDPKFRPQDYAVPAYFNGDEAALKKARFGPYH